MSEPRSGDHDMGLAEDLRCGGLLLWEGPGGGTLGGTVGEALLPDTWRVAGHCGTPSEQRSHNAFKSGF